MPTVKEKIQAGIDAGVSVDDLKSRMKELGLTKSDLDLDYEEAKKRGASRLAQKTIKEAQSSLESSFGFSTDRKIISIRKATEDSGIQLTKTCTISDKKTYDFIVKLLNLNTSVENDFSIDAHNGLFVLNILNHTTAPQEEEVIEFQVTNVGEISEEQDLSADVSSVPTAESFGVEAAVEEEVEDAVMPEPTYEDATEERDDQEDNTEEDVW
jgi:hypothetical protein